MNILLSSTWSVEDTSGSNVPLPLDINFPPARKQVKI